MEKEAKRPNRARLLFEHIFNVTQDYRAALTLAEHCNDAVNEIDDDADDGHHKGVEINIIVIEYTYIISSLGSTLQIMSICSY